MTPKANGKITAADLKLAAAVRALAPRGGSVPAAGLAARLGVPVQGRGGLLNLVDAAERHGVGHWYTYQGERYVALSTEGWELKA